MRDRAPGANHAALVLVAVPGRDPLHVFAREMRVIVDEALLALEAHLLEQIPELDGIGHGAALVIRIVGEIAVQRRVGLVEKFFAARDHRVAGQLLRPGPELAKQRQIVGVHLRVGLVAQRPDDRPRNE